MELMESIGWIVIGFVPTLLSLEVGYRFGKRSKRPLPDIPKLKELRSI